MRQFWLTLAFGWVGLFLLSSAGLAQGIPGSNGGGSLGIAPKYAAPGNYGTTWGSPSFGSVRTWTAYSSPYGAGYGYGYPSYAIIPGAYGMGLWRPGYTTASGYTYGGAFYNTFAAPYQTGAGFGPVPFGAYAPAFGPPFIPHYGPAY